jgi:hypothetical protein
LAGDFLIVCLHFESFRYDGGCYSGGFVQVIFRMWLLHGCVSDCGSIKGVCLRRCVVLTMGMTHRYVSGMVLTLGCVSGGGSDLGVCCSIRLWLVVRGELLCAAFLLLYFVTAWIWYCSLLWWPLMFGFV